jgi:hypothetical protein
MQVMQWHRKSEPEKPLSKRKETMKGNSLLRNPTLSDLAEARLPLPSPRNTTQPPPNAIRFDLNITYRFEYACSRWKMTPLELLHVRNYLLRSVLAGLGS